jgi:transcriptional regulator with XRE-family HTH domain
VKGTGVSSGTAHNLLNSSREPSYSVIYALEVMVNVPWQLLTEERPVIKSYSAPTVYFYNGSAEEKRIEDLLKERNKIIGIKGYRILNPEYLFDREPEQVTG